LAIHKKGPVSYFSFNQLDNEGILHGIFMRHGGCSPQPWSSLNLATSVGDSRENVIENRNRISDSLGIERNTFFDVWQVHSSKVIYSDKPRRVGEPHMQADGILTDQPEIALLMLFADCVPILFYDPRKKAGAVAHSGWQGTVKQVAAATAKAMVDQFACNAADIMACIGPSICQEHYQVGEEVAAAADRLFDRKEKVVLQKRDQYFVNLQLANQIILERAGLRMIEQANICTACNNPDWFSHRAEKGQAGRFGAVLTLKNNG